MNAIVAFLYHLTVLTKILTKQSNYLQKNSNILFITRLSYSLLQEILHLMQTHHQRSERNIAMKNIYVGKLPKDITKEDICQLFSLNQTSYLRGRCSIDFSINNKTGKFKGFTFIRAPAHILNELMKIDGIAYHGEKLKSLNQLEKKPTTTLQMNLKDLSQQ